MSTVEQVTSIITAVAAVIAVLMPLIPGRDRPDRPLWLLWLIRVTRPTDRDAGLALGFALLAWSLLLMLAVVVANSTTPLVLPEALLRYSSAAAVMPAAFLGVRGMVSASRRDRPDRAIRAGAALVAAGGALLGTSIMA